MNNTKILQLASEAVKNQAASFGPVFDAKGLGITLDRAFTAMEEWAATQQVSDQVELVATVAAIRGDSLVERFDMDCAEIIYLQQPLGPGLNPSDVAWLVIYGDCVPIQSLQDLLLSHDISHVYIVVLGTNSQYVRQLTDLINLPFTHVDQSIACAMPCALVYDEFCYEYMNTILGIKGSKSMIANVLKEHDFRHDMLLQDANKLKVAVDYQ